MATNEVEIEATPKLRTARHLAHLYVRTARQAARARRGGPARTVIEAGRARLEPVTPAQAAGWFALLRAVGRPPAGGLASSFLGGQARTARQWRAMAKRLQRARTPAYLVRVDDAIAGEVLGSFDLATAAVELTVWLAPDAVGVADDVLAGLVRELLGGRVRRLVLSAPDDTPLAAAARREGFVDEGVVTDPPFGDRHIFVRHHQPS